MRPFPCAAHLTGVVSTAAATARRHSGRPRASVGCGRGQGGRSLRGRAGQWHASAGGGVTGQRRSRATCRASAPDSVAAPMPEGSREWVVTPPGHRLRVVGACPCVGRARRQLGGSPRSASAGRTGRPPRSCLRRCRMFESSTPAAGAVVVASPPPPRALLGAQTRCVAHGRLTPFSQPWAAVTQGRRSARCRP